MHVSYILDKSADEVATSAIFIFGSDLIWLELLV